MKHRRKHAPGNANRPPVGEVAPEGLGVDLERIVFFSDAVFAIAITLLALEIRLPDDVLTRVVGDFGALWAALVPKIASYATSFLVVGIYWAAHHRFFHYIRNFDHTLMWLNLAFLMCIAFLPVPSGLLGEHGDKPAPVVLYAGTMVLTGLMAGLVWWHAARRHRLVDPDLSARVIRHNLYRGWIPPVVFLLSIGIAFSGPDGPYFAEWSWAAIFVITLALNRTQPPSGYAEAGSAEM